jgi:hypothetical protein
MDSPKIPQKNHKKKRAPIAKNKTPKLEKWMKNAKNEPHEKPKKHPKTPKNIKKTPKPAQKTRKTPPKSLKIPQITYNPCG